MSKTEDLKRAIFAIADPDKVSPFNGDMVTLFLHEIEKLVESAIAAELRRRQESELMADCMDMVRRDLIAARVIDATVPPMMVPEAVVAALQTAIAAEREACAKVCDRIASAIKLYCNEAHVVACAEAIRNRGAK